MAIPPTKSSNTTERKKVRDKNEAKFVRSLNGMKEGVSIANCDVAVLVGWLYYGVCLGREEEARYRL